MKKLILSALLVCAAGVQAQVLTQSISGQRVYLDRTSQGAEFIEISAVRKWLTEDEGSKVKVYAKARIIEFTSSSDEVSLYGVSSIGSLFQVKGKGKIAKVNERTGAVRFAGSNGWYKANSLGQLTRVQAISGLN